MHDIESIVAGLKRLKDDACRIDASSIMAHMIAMALHEATLFAWDQIMREPDENRKAARFFRLYAILPKD